MKLLYQCTVVNAKDAFHALAGQTNSNKMIEATFRLLSNTTKVQPAKKYSLSGKKSNRDTHIHPVCKLRERDKKISGKSNSKEHKRNLRHRLILTNILPKGQNKKEDRKINMLTHEYRYFV